MQFERREVAFGRGLVDDLFAGSRSPELFSKPVNEESALTPLRQSPVQMGLENVHPGEKERDRIAGEILGHDLDVRTSVTGDKNNIYIN